MSGTLHGAEGVSGAGFIDLLEGASSERMDLPRFRGRVDI
jgi:hypothetical protein